MIYTLLLLFFGLQPFAQSSLARQAKPDELSSKLNKSVNNYNLGMFNLLEALVRVSNDFKIPMGIAWVNSPAERAELPFAWKDATVKQVIEDIAKTRPGYQVEVKDGVVHVSPSPESIPGQENFLKLRIESFEVNNADVEVASFKLHTLVTPRKYGQISIGATGDSKVTVKLTNPTVQQALDALALASNRKIWIVSFVNDGTLTPRGLRRSMSLWSDKPQPDDEQPGWDLLRWGDPLPPPASASK